MVAPSLTNVPPDIILSISEYLDIPTLLSLRSTSHDFDALFAPLALRCAHICLDNSVAGVDRVLTQSSEPVLAIYDHAKHLTLQTNAWYVSRYIDETRIVNVYEMIGRFKSLTSLTIKWRIGHDDLPDALKFTQEIQERFVDAVLKATGGQLHSLTMQPSPHRENGISRLPPGLDTFKALKAFSSALDKDGWYCDGRDRWGERSSWYDPSKLEEHGCKLQGHKACLQSLIRGNPQLEAIVICQGCVINFYDADVLFIGGSDDKREQPLPALRMLTLKCVKFPCTISAQPTPFNHLQHLEVLSLYDTLPLDYLWSSLRVAGTTLRTLKTHQVSYPLVSYLASYSGLQELAIQDIQDIPECTSPKITMTFFQDALPRHSSSLIRLRISLYADVEYLEGWAFAPSLWVPALDNLTSLKSLHLYAGDPKRFQTPEAEDEDEDKEEDYEDYEAAEKARRRRAATALAGAYREVLQNFEQLKSLECLEIILPSQRFGCGTGHNRWKKESMLVVSQAAEKLRSENGNPKLLKLFSGSYHPRRDELGGGWRYTSRDDDENGSRNSRYHYWLY